MLNDSVEVGTFQVKRTAFGAAVALSGGLVSRGAVGQLKVVKVVGSDSIPPRRPRIVQSKPEGLATTNQVTFSPGFRPVSRNVGVDSSVPLSLTSLPSCLR